MVPHDEPDRPRGRLVGPVLLGVLAGLQAAVVGLLVVTLPVLALWLAGAGGGSRVADAVRDGGMIWLSAHHTRFTVDNGTVQLAPLGLTLLLGGIAWWFARRVGRALALEDEAGHAGRAHAAFVLTYTVLGLVVSLLAATAKVRPQPETAVPGLLVFSALAVAVPLHRAPGSWRTPVRTRFGAWLRTAVAAVMFPVAVAVLLVAGLLVAGFHKVGSVYDALHPGLFGSLGLAAIHLALLPNALVWLLSWFTGPGFQVGVGTSVTSGHTVLGPLPALPMLGILPGPGRHGAWVGWLAVAVVLVGGLLAGRVLGRWHDAAETPGSARLVDVAVTALVAALGVALLSWWTSGPLGGGVMAWWGIASPWFPLAFGLLSGLGVLAALVLAPLWQRARAGRPGRH